MLSASCGFPDGPQHTGSHLLSVIGPTLHVHAGFDQTYRIGQGTPSLPNVDLPALVDTGAAESCIDSTLAQSLNLPPVDRQSLAGVHGAQTVNRYLAQVYVPQFAMGHCRTVFRCTPYGRRNASLCDHWKEFPETLFNDIQRSDRFSHDCPRQLARSRIKQITEAFRQGRSVNRAASPNCRHRNAWRAHARGQSRCPL